MVNHELITLLTDEKLDIDAALRGSGDGLQQRFVRNEIWAGDRQPALCRVDERIEQAQVVLVREAGSAWHDLAQHIKVEKIERHGQEGHIGCCHHGGKSGLFAPSDYSKGPE